MKFVTHQTTLHLSSKIKCCVDRLRPPGKTGKYLLVLSFSQFDPKGTKRRFFSFINGRTGMLLLRRNCDGGWPSRKSEVLKLWLIRKREQATRCGDRARRTIER